jgi:hypothetical protein
MLQGPEDQARLRSIVCRTSGGFPHTAPTCMRSSLPDSEFIDPCQFRMGVTGYVLHVPSATCHCGATMQGNEAMSCKRIGSSWLHYWHDIVTAALGNATSRAGLSSTRDPIYVQLDRDNDEAGHATC